MTAVVASPTARATRCAACGAADLEVVHEVPNVPINSCILVDDRRAAVDFPTGRIVLTFCHGCGFIGNAAFEPERIRYGEGYEETQAFSPRFRAFAQDLAERLVERHGLHGREILEIGCGKGEFLALLCALGENRGTGIDPGYVPGRLDDPGVERMEVITDFYGPEYRHLTGDLVLCRHTLEHIFDVRAFVELARQSAERRPGAVVVFEVPDTGRVLREGAFWDIYYEHVSYFTPSSLRRLFVAADCHVEGVEVEYDEQYLILTARARPASSAPPLDPGEVLMDYREVAAFRERHAKSVDRWQAQLDLLRGRRPVLWGSGSKAVAWLTTLGVTDQIEYVVDINPNRHGKFLPGTGIEIVAPERLRSYRPEAVIAMNPIYRDEIARDLADLGLRPELLAV